MKSSWQQYLASNVGTHLWVRFSVLQQFEQTSYLKKKKRKRQNINIALEIETVFDNWVF